MGARWEVIWLIWDVFWSTAVGNGPAFDWCCHDEQIFTSTISCTTVWILAACLSLLAVLVKMDQYLSSGTSCVNQPAWTGIQFKTQWTVWHCSMFLAVWLLITGCQELCCNSISKFISPIYTLSTCIWHLEVRLKHNFNLNTFSKSTECLKIKYCIQYFSIKYQ